MNDVAVDPFDSCRCATDDGRRRRANGAQHVFPSILPAARAEKEPTILTRVVTHLKKWRAIQNKAANSYVIEIAI